jgi:hypothetical protein
MNIVLGVTQQTFSASYLIDLDEHSDGSGEVIGKNLVARTTINQTCLFLFLTITSLLETYAV